jgi:5-methylcytosine-specific restriction enzyme A
MSLPRPCLTPGCPAVVTGKTSHCPTHAPPDSRRKDPAQARFYGSKAWKRLREYVRREEPTCAMCKERPSTQVHHRDGDWRNNDRRNLEAVCDPCHRSHSGRDHHAKRGQEPEPKDGGAWLV